MEIKVLEKSDDTVKLEVIGGSQSLLNFIKEEADNVPGVKFAGFVMEHPLERKSILIIKSDKDIDSVLKKVIEKSKKDLETAKKEIIKLF